VLMSGRVGSSSRACDSVIMSVLMPTLDALGADVGRSARGSGCWFPTLTLQKVSMPPTIAAAARNGRSSTGPVC
jgi:hypothetical protein